MITSPIHVAELAGKPLRFFQAPSEQPEFPYHAADDLFLILGFDRPLRRYFARAQQRSIGGMLSTVATSTGPVVISPHCAAQGLIGAAEQAGPHRIPPNMAFRYAEAAAEALKIIAGDLPPGAFVDFLTAVAHNSGYAG